MLIYGSSSAAAALGGSHRAVLIQFTSASEASTPLDDNHVGRFRSIVCDGIDEWRLMRPPGAPEPPRSKPNRSASRIQFHVHFTQRAVYSHLFIEAQITHNYGAVSIERRWREIRILSTPFNQINKRRTVCHLPGLSRRTVPSGEPRRLH